MFSKELKKGMTVELTNGWSAVIVGKPGAATVLAEVHGFYKEIGSIYLWNIKGIELTPKQLQAKRNIERMI